MHRAQEELQRRRHGVQSIVGLLVKGQVIEKRLFGLAGRLGPVDQNPVPEPGVMGADVADVVDGPHPAYQLFATGHAIVGGHRRLVRRAEARHEIGQHAEVPAFDTDPERQGRRIFLEEVGDEVFAGPGRRRIDPRQPGGMILADEFRIEGAPVPVDIGVTSPESVGAPDPGGDLDPLDGEGDCGGCEIGLGGSRGEQSINGGRCGRAGVGE